MDGRAFVSLTDDSDRIIVVGEAEHGQQGYKVDSRAMSRASPIWKAMFSTVNGFRESNPDVPVEFPEDDPEAWLIILKIIHYRFNEVPNELSSFNDLIEMAIFCDKYDTVSLVRPFVEAWLRPWIEFCMEPGYEHWLFIAWTFGCQDIFDTLTASLVLKLEVYNDGKIKRWIRPRSRQTSENGAETSEEICVSDENMPPEILDSILAVRKETIRQFKTLFKGIGADLAKNKLCKRPHLHDEIYCCTYMLGLFIKAFDRFGLNSYWVPPQKIIVSIKHIAYIVNSFDFGLDIRGYVTPCDLGAILLPEVERIFQSIPSAVLDHHKHHIENQAKKSGVGHLKPQRLRRN